MGNSYDQSREFMPAGLADVQASYPFPRRSYRSQSETHRASSVSSASSRPQESPSLNSKKAREIETYLKQLGDRLDHTRREEVSGIAPTGARPEVAR